MTDKVETLKPVLGMAHGRTIGGEPAFTYPDVLDVLAICTRHAIAVLGVEVFKAQPRGVYQTEGISTYEVQIGELAWPQFVNLNNSLAAEFVRENPTGDDHFSLLTASGDGEFSSLAS